MGNIEEKIQEIYSIISQIRNEISSIRAFELGTDRAALNRQEIHLENVASIFKELESVYDAKPFGDAKAYFAAIRIVHEARSFLKEIRRKDEGNTENTQIFMDYLDELTDTLADFLSSPVDEQKKEDHHYVPSYPLSVTAETAHRSTIIIDTTKSSRQLTIDRAQIKFWLLRILSFIFLDFPRMLGRAVLDIFGRGKDSEVATSVLLGYGLITGGVMVLWGIIDLDSLLDWFTAWWRFFNPAK